MFKMRTTKPEAGNKYYITKSRGGYSDAVEGKPTDPECNVLSNCVGYAYGRFNEIGNYGYCKYLRPVNAENFIQYANGLRVGFEPKVGACMVWQKGSTLGNCDGAGHVAIVEKVISSSEVITSESGWNCSPFWNQNRKRGSGNWGQKYPYKFLGFIYNPAIDNGNIDDCGEINDNYNKRLLYYGCSGEDVKKLQKDLQTLKYDIGKYGADGQFGLSTKNAVIKFQKDNSLNPDGVVGVDTYNAIDNSLKNVNVKKVKVTANVLNVRTGAGTNYPIVTGIPKGYICSILEKEENWGKIDNPNGWICLDYCEYV